MHIYSWVSGLRVYLGCFVPLISLFILQRAFGYYEELYVSTTKLMSTLLS